MHLKRATLAFNLCSRSCFQIMKGSLNLILFEFNCAMNLILLLFLNYLRWKPIWLCKPPLIYFSYKNNVYSALPSIGTWKKLMEWEFFSHPGWNPHGWNLGWGQNLPFRNTWLWNEDLSKLLKLLMVIWKILRHIIACQTRSLLMIYTIKTHWNEYWSFFTYFLNTLFPFYTVYLTW